MQLSVIILNYNVRYFLEQCVLSVQDALKNIDGEIIVIDNCSQDDSSQMIRNRFPQIKFIENKENLGFPKGNNIGVAQANGDYVCVLNPDTVVAEDTFEKVLAFAKKQQNIGIVGCKLIDGTGRFLPESKRGVPLPWVAFTKIFGLYKLFPKISVFNQYYAQHLPENQSGKVDILVGAFMFMQRQLYLDLGGFDEKCFMYSDDIDLSYLALQSGRNNYYFSETTVIHYKGESTVRDKKYMQRFQEAMEFFYKKHFKKSLFFTFFMKLGAFVFSFFKMAKPVKKNRKIEEYWLFSDNESLPLQLEKVVTKKIVLQKINFQNSTPFIANPNSKHIEIIFDNNCLSFGTIITVMEKLSSEWISFKIIPKNSNFMIGSNSSNERGEVVTW